MHLDARDRALATRLAYGAVQRRATLDHLIETLAGRPVARLEPLVLAALRLGLYQLAFLDRVPAHAAVGESVELVKRESPGGGKLVNAVLRRGAREAAPARRRAARRHAGRGRAAPLPSGVDRGALVRTRSAPDAARALMAADNEPAEGALRVNTLRTGPCRAGGAAARGHHAPPVSARGPRARRRVRRVRLAAVGRGPVHAAVARRDDGRAAARTPARRAGARPVRRARRQDDAPGGADGGPWRASSPSSATPDAPTRCAGPPRGWARSIVAVRTADAAGPHEPAAYDRVLVDPPCSDLGTLASRPDARWRKPAGLPARLAVEQAAILRAGADALRPGGTLVYSTCTISPVENEDVVARVPCRA